MKYLAILLSLFLLYPRVAWAVEACLHSDGHSSHVTSTSEHHHNFESASEDSGSSDDSIPVIHCPHLFYEVSLVGEPPTTQLRSLTEQALLYTSLATAPAVSLDGTSLWLSALFKRILTFSLPNDFAQHLFLSVLQI